MFRTYQPIDVKEQEILLDFGLLRKMMVGIMAIQCDAPKRDTGRVPKPGAR